nr:hypothetical protein [Myxococcota bacterium]
MRFVGCVLVALLAAAAACGPRETRPSTPEGVRGPGSNISEAAPVDAPTARIDQQATLAAIQKAMNELDEAAQGCWAVAATERFDIEGELDAQIEIAPGRATATIIRDTARNKRLATCLVDLLGAYPWAPPLHGQAIQLPFKFRAPDGQNVIERPLVAWNGQGKVSVAVLLDENNSGNGAASMIELALQAGGSTGMRLAERAELWYFLGAATMN